MRTNNQLAETANPGCLRIDTKLVIGASGAVASYRGMRLKDTTAPPILSATGQYLITFDQVFNDLVSFSGSMLQQGSESLEVLIIIDNTSSNGTVQIQTRNSSGAATNPTSGDILYLSFVVDVAGLAW